MASSTGSSDTTSDPSNFSETDNPRSISERGFIFSRPKALCDPCEEEEKQINQAHKDQMCQIQYQTQYRKQSSGLTPHSGQYQTDDTEHDADRGNQNADYGKRPASETHPEPNHRESIQGPVRAIVDIESILRLPGAAPGALSLPLLYHMAALPAWVLIHHTCLSNLPM